MRPETKHTLDPVSEVSPDRLLHCAYAEKSGPYMHMLKYIIIRIVQLVKNRSNICLLQVSDFPLYTHYEKPTLLDGHLNSCYGLKTYVFFSQSSLVLARSGCNIRVTHFHLLVILHSKNNTTKTYQFHSIHPCNMNELGFSFIT